MPYLTDEIDEGATRRRLDEITSAGARSLDERLAHSAQIDEEFRQAQARMEQEAKAMDELVADAHAKHEAEGDKDDQETTPNQWASREAKSTVLSFFNDEHTETAPASAPSAPPIPQPPPPAPIPPPMPAEPPPSPARMLSLGYEEDEPEPPPAPPVQQQPTGRHAAQRRSAPKDDEDDFSDVNWMR